VLGAEFDVLPVLTLVLTLVLALALVLLAFPFSSGYSRPLEGGKSQRHFAGASVSARPLQAWLLPDLQYLSELSKRQVFSSSECSMCLCVLPYTR